MSTGKVKNCLGYLHWLKQVLVNRALISFIGRNSDTVTVIDIFKPCKLNA